MPDTLVAEIGTGVIVEWNGKFLVSRRLDATKRYYNCWQFPGGHVERGEMCGPAAAREFGEETGLEPAEGERWAFVPAHYYEGHAAEEGWITFFFHIVFDEEPQLPTNPEPHKHTDWEWKTEAEILALENILPGIPYVFNLRKKA